jgi:acyl carrier protein
MTTSTVESLKRVVAESLSVPPEKVTEEASFVDDLGAGSLDLVEMVMTLEEEFGVEIPDADYPKLITVGDAIRYIGEREIAEVAE